MVRAGKLAAVGELAGKIAHEINNPIGIISAKCRLLLADHSQEMSKKISDELVKITDAADRVSDIAQGLLSYCRPSVASRQPLDLTEPISRALAMIEQSADRKGVEINNRLPGHLPPVIANANEMQQVFLNLFLNALDATSEGDSITLTASVPEIEKKPPPHYLTLRISDTGTGIPPDILDQIYEPFFSTKAEGKGTGLGLSICTGLVRSHDGMIDIVSEPGEGSTVIIHLPIHNINGDHRG